MFSETQECLVFYVQFALVLILFSMTLNQFLMKNYRRYPLQILIGQYDYCCFNYHTLQITALALKNHFWEVKSKYCKFQFV